MAGKGRLLLPLLLASSGLAQSSGEAASADQRQNVARFRFLSDAQAADCAPDIDGAQAAFRNDAHDLVVNISHSRSTMVADRSGSETDVLQLDIETGARSVSWQIMDRDRRIARYRIANLMTRRDGALAIIVQRQGNGGAVLSSVMVLHGQMDDQETDLPDYRGEMWDRVGEDVDGDGTQELLVPDSRFAGAFGPGGNVPAPSLVYALQHGRYVDASRDGSYIAYFRRLQQNASAACNRSDGLMTAPERAACYAIVAGLSARSGEWPLARHQLRQLGSNISANEPPLRDNGTSWDEAMAGLLVQWGYLPLDQSVRWWSESWVDFFGNVRSGDMPFEVQMLVHDLQGCTYFSEESARNPNGTPSENIIDLTEQHCLRPDGDGDFIGVGDLQWEWIRGKYRNDVAVRRLLEDSARR